MELTNETRTVSGDAWKVRMTALCLTKDEANANDRFVFIYSNKKKNSLHITIWMYNEFGFLWVSIHQPCGKYNSSRYYFFDVVFVAAFLAVAVFAAEVFFAVVLVAGFLAGAFLAAGLAAGFSLPSSYFASSVCKRAISLSLYTISSPWLRMVVNKAFN